eukprot:7637335-Alexandrium_andersonii.AAC.1
MALERIILPKGCRTPYNAGFCGMIRCWAVVGACRRSQPQAESTEVFPGTYRAVGWSLGPALKSFL